MGIPVPYDLLATEAATECNYIKNNICLVSLFLEEAEYPLIPDWEEKMETGMVGMVRGNERY